MPKKPSPRSRKPAAAAKAWAKARDLILRGRLGEARRLLQAIARVKGPYQARARLLLAQLASPFAPHVAEECWARIGGQGLVATAPWPKADPALLTSDTVLLPVQVNGKKRAEIVLPANAAEDEIERAARTDANVLPHLAGMTVRKIIVVKGRIVNIVAS